MSSENTAVSPIRRGFSRMAQSLTAFAAIAAAPALFGASASQTPLALAPFTFAGRIVDYAHVAYDADAAVEVRVKNMAGALLAKTTTATTATNGVTRYNYAVDVPLASKPLVGHAVAGDRVSFEFVDPAGVVYAGLVASSNAVVGLPGAVGELDVVLAADSDGDGVADEYLETIDYLMWKHGVEGDYDATADYDGDGQSNYAEYVAGTNPFDATDKFSVRQMTVDEGVDGYVALRIPVSRGRSYVITASPELAPADWTVTEFTLDASVPPSATHLMTSMTESGYKTIFVPKKGASRFYKVNVE